MLTITKYFLGHTIKVYSPRDYLQIRYLILSLLSLHLTEFTNQCIEGYQLLTNNNISQTHKGSHIQRSLGEDSLRWEASWLLEAVVVVEVVEVFVVVEVVKGVDVVEVVEVVVVEDSLRWEASWLLEADKSGTPHIVEVEVKVKW